LPEGEPFVILDNGVGVSGRNPRGSSTNNPVDLRSASVFEVDLYGRAAVCVGLDPRVDGLIFQGQGVTPELENKYATLLVQVQQGICKSFLVVSWGAYTWSRNR